MKFLQNIFNTRNPEPLSKKDLLWQVEASLHILSAFSKLDYEGTKNSVANSSAITLHNRSQFKASIKLAHGLNSSLTSYRDKIENNEISLNDKKDIKIMVKHQNRFNELLKKLGGDEISIKPNRKVKSIRPDGWKDDIYFQSYLRSSSDGTNLSMRQELYRSISNSVSGAVNRGTMGVDAVKSAELKPDIDSAFQNIFENKELTIFTKIKKYISNLDKSVIRLFSEKVDDEEGRGKIVNFK